MKKLVLWMLICFSVIVGAKENKEIILATTTSVRDSGLMDYLVPQFEKESGYRINLIAVGTGKALQMGRDGEADILLVHAKSSELEFMKDGHGVERRELAHNYFVLVGPKFDENIKTVEEAFQKIEKEKLTFVSRGDDSGTNKKEISLWENVNIEPKSDWYVSSGNGMGATLKIANELNAYTLSDIGTYLNLKDSLDTGIVVGEDESLLNLYSVMRIDPSKNKHINEEGAKVLMEWLTSDEVKAKIGQYGIDRFGMTLFTPEY